jgi:hypothetical protein
MNNDPLREIQLQKNMGNYDLLYKLKLHTFQGVCDFALANSCMYVTISTETRVHV